MVYWMNTLFNLNNDTLKPNFEIIGKWNGKKYTVIRALGAGENGKVYLVKTKDGEYALKASDATIDLSYEIQVIKKLGETQGSSLGFYVFDIDDFIYNNKIYTYYVMPYFKGITIKNFLYGRKSVDFFIVFKKVIEILLSLHEEGWVFGDLKSDHIIIDPSTRNISLIDFGGVTFVNQGVRQYTEAFDRGNWRAGSRKADPHYDLFSLSMVFIQLCLGENKLIKILNTRNSLNNLYGIIHNINNLELLSPIIERILKGELIDTRTVLNELNNFVAIDEKKYNSFNWIDWLLATSTILFILTLGHFIYFY